MNPVIIIPARLGATRLPDKPLADIHGHPMISLTARRGLESGISDVYVACDDKRIVSALKNEDVQTIMTSDTHKSGSDRVFEAVEKIDSTGRFDIVINLQGDLPLIDPDVIKSVLHVFEVCPKADISTAVTVIADENEKIDPHVVKAVLTQASSNKNNEKASSLRSSVDAYQALYFTRAPAPYGEGEMYHHIGIYAYRREALKRFVNLPQSPLEKQEKLEQLRAIENGMNIYASVVDSVPIGVDTQEDLEKVRSIMFSF